MLSLDILKFRKIDFEWFERLRLRLKFQKESSGLLYMYLLGIKVYIDSNKPQTFYSVYVPIYLELFAKCLISFFPFSHGLQEQESFAEYTNSPCY